MATEVDYRTARRHDMAAIARAAHAKGALVINDLSHSAGACQVNIGDADFAVGCTYKYLNGGPGAPGFVYVSRRLQDQAASALVGWFGHARPFDFSTAYEPAKGISRQLCGTQSVLAMTALDEAINIWADVDLAVLEDKSRSLCQAFIGLVEQHCNAFGLKLAGPRDMRSRGSHVSFHCPQGYAVMQALIARKVTGDFRAPDMIRFGFAALYNTHVEVFDAVQDLAQVLKSDEWNRPEYLAKKSVT
jgi:kynureninase